jgi:hypothetical protein
MNHSLYQDGILKALPFKRLPWGGPPPGVVGAPSLSGADAVIPVSGQPLDGSTSRQKPEPIFGASCSPRHDETLEFHHGHAAGLFRR